MSPIRLLRWVEVLVLLGGAAWAYFFYATEPARLPRDSDYRMAADRLSAEARPGDAIYLDPQWAERLRLFATPKSVPILNLERRAVREDLDGYRRLFVLSLPRLHRSDAEGTGRWLEALGFREAEALLSAAETENRLVLRRFDNEAPALPALRASGALPRARVYIERADKSQEACPFNASLERFQCARKPWLKVEAEFREIDGKPFHCLYAHPVGREPMVIDFPALELGKTLRFYGGIVGQVVYRHDAYTPLDVSLSVDGAVLEVVTFNPGEPGEQRRVFDTSALAPGPHRVTVALTAENPDQRRFCFDIGVYR